MWESLQPAGYGVSVTFYVLSTVTILLRIYSRKFIIRSFGWDDWCMVSILFFNTAQQALLLIFLHYGGGLHITLVSVEDLSILIKCLFAEEIYYIWMHFIIKTALLLFYLRLAHKPSFSWSVYATMGLNTAFTITIWLVYCFQCIPLAAFFDAAAYPDAKCLSHGVSYYFVASLSILTDCIILILPIPPLWSIQASVRRRIMLIAVITFGGSAVLVSFFRLIVLHQFDVNPDFTFTLGKMVIVSAIELDIAIMAANAPSLKAVWLKYVCKRNFTSADVSSYNKHAVSGGSGGHLNGSRSHELSAMSKMRRSGHQRVPSINNTAQEQGVGEQWRNDSEEELFQNKKGIMVTSSVGVDRDVTSSPDDLNRPYFEFTKTARPA